MRFEPRDPDWEAATRAGFARQGLMQSMGLEIVHLVPGEIHEEMEFDPRFAEGGGGLHGGAVTSGLDTVCASAAGTLTGPGDGVLTVELKTSFLRYAKGERFRFEGRVVKPGRSLIFSEGQCWVLGEEPVLAATMTATMMVIPAKRAAEAEG